jgi:hypothetical protein
VSSYLLAEVRRQSSNRIWRVPMRDARWNSPVCTRPFLEQWSFCDEEN